MQNNAGEKDKASSGALARGLSVLVAINDLRSATVSGLVNETNLPKPTVIRLLHTLVELGFVAHDTQTATYNVTSSVASLSRGLMDRGPVDGLIKEVLDDLADSLKWPIEMLQRESGSMVVRTNNRDRAPIKLTLFERRRFGLIKSAAGIAVIADLDVAEQREMIAKFARSDAEASDAHAAVALARTQGFAHRFLTELAENMAVASVAIPKSSAALSLVYFEDVLPLGAFEKNVLPLLKAGAAAIGKILSDHQ